ncbi:hypothetical protein PoB_000452200 [Plakobranchus ocellatus]|uniref:Uncharacterized protein n=1 Tax=Plakobranchus ocellatus TaxID=259542 RepID=A0AAV3Y5G1_9GAST|nr:hypothetical protein PoB_000452200 [Plakobranchus ocellatus]
MVIRKTCMSVRHSSGEAGSVKKRSVSVTVKTRGVSVTVKKRSVIVSVKKRSVNVSVKKRSVNVSVKTRGVSVTVKKRSVNVSVKTFWIKGRLDRQERAEERELKKLQAEVETDKTQQTAPKPDMSAIRQPRMPLLMDSRD